MLSTRRPTCGLFIPLLMMTLLTGCRDSAEETGAVSDTAVPARSEAEATGSVGEEAHPPAPPPPAESSFTAYYFHWTIRCQTCLEIEEMSREAISTSFADQLARGRLRWRAHNMELPEYAHFLEDFDLSTPSLVLVRRQGEMVAEWKVLQRVWDLVEEPWNLEAYVVEETRQFLSLGESPASDESTPG
ncbi:MAG: hypothetical protein JSV91_08155 [Phycisphaerales bacterium]|nr:MAG: hypothetical protein JSV91_08155 [Phycisphaerales bacterium]